MEGGEEEEGLTYGGGGGGGGGMTRTGHQGVKRTGRLVLKVVLRFRYGIWVTHRMA